MRFLRWLRYKIFGHRWTIDMDFAGVPDPKRREVKSVILLESAHEFIDGVEIFNQAHKVDD